MQRNTRDATATFFLDPPEPGEEVGIEPSAVHFRWHRPNAETTIELEHEGEVVRPSDWSATPDGVNVGTAGGGRLRLDLRRYQVAFRAMSRAIYHGPFRNAVNVGGSASYYDLQIGQQFITRWDQFKTGNNRAQNRAAIAVEKELQHVFPWVRGSRPARLDGHRGVGPEDRRRNHGAL